MKDRGFSLIELLVVLTIIGSLLTLVAPRFYQNIDRGREAVLRENLNSLRRCIDLYYSDKGVYPPSLDALLQERYLRQIPRDPVTDSTSTWMLVRTSPPEVPGIADVKSGADGVALDGSRYREW